MNEKKIRDFLAKFYRKSDIGMEDNIFELGIINSMFSMQLVMFLEREFNLTVENDDIDMNNFSTIANIVSFIDGKTA